MLDFISEYYLVAKFLVIDTFCLTFDPLLPQSLADNCTRFGDGFFVTFELLILSSLMGVALAMIVAMARINKSRLISWPAYAYVYFFRGTPLLLQLWILYYGVGGLGEEALGIFWPLVREGWTAGLIILTLNTAAYSAEILRGGIINVARGQIEASRAIGMSGLNNMRWVVLPQAWRIALPAYGNEVVLLLKGSALVSTITVFDLMGVTRTVFARSYDLSNFLYASVMYLVMAMIIGRIFKTIENYLRKRGRVA